MKAKEFIASLSDKYNNKLKIIKKWIFRIMINEDAFFIHKNFNFKLTILDKNNIQVWFPESSKEKWLKIFQEKNIAYFVFQKIDKSYETLEFFNWKEYTNLFNFDIEDYTFTRERILWLKKLWLEEKNESNFLLKDKLEDIYVLFIELIMKLPKKDRYFLREKIERLFLNLFEDVYSYMYNLGDRKEELQNIFKNSMLLREYFRLLYKIWKIKNENVYLDIWDRWIEVLKICKWIKSKY